MERLSKMMNEPIVWAAHGERRKRDQEGDLSGQFWRRGNVKHEKETFSSQEHNGEWRGRSGLHQLCQDGLWGPVSFTGIVYTLFFHLWHFCLYCVCIGKSLKKSGFWKCLDRFTGKTLQCRWHKGHAVLFRNQIFRICTDLNPMAQLERNRFTC